VTRTFSTLLTGALAVLALAVCTENELGRLSLTAKAAETGGGSPGASTPTRSSEQAFNDECGACHFAFPPQFLPARSWQAIMAGLDNHFGENASLDADTAKQITDYLVANAAGPGSPVLRGLDPQETPLRITETRLWNRIHHEIRPSVYDRPDIKSKSNCLACHGGGARVGDD
jgi:Dihaem cytochrome c